VRWREAALVGLAALAVHARTLGFDFTGLDDRDLLVDDQPFLSHPSALWRVFSRSYMHVVDAGHAYYRPLVTASYALDAQWSGVRPLGYHLTNVALHVAASCLLLALLRRLALGRGAALAGAMVFAVHPALAPAVAWIPGRNDSLLAVFVLGAWLLFLRDRARPSWGARAGHLALFALALLTKETAVVLPLVCLAHVALLEPQAWARLRRPAALTGFAAAWGALVCARLLVHPGGGAATARDLAANLPLLEMSLGALVLPVRPTVLAVVGDLPLWPGVVALFGLAAATRLVAGVRLRVVALGAAVFVLFLAPSLAVPGTLVLGHRLYLPACGVLLVIAEIVRALALEPRVLAAWAGVTVATLALLTVAFEGAYRDRRSFAREAVAGSPGSALAHFCLGQSLQLDGDDDGALAEYRAALAIGPTEVAHNNIAVIAMRRARWAEAEQELRQELDLDPRYGRAYYNLGIVLRREDRPGEACAAEEQALALAPGDEAARQERDRDCAP
jgi:tetratricopeptide (TPR) repeat protein